MTKIFTMDNMDGALPYMDKKVFDYIYECCTENFECFDNFDLIVFDFYDIRGDGANCGKLMIYTDKCNLLIFCENNPLKDKVTKMISELKHEENGNCALVMYRFFERLLRGDPGYLQGYEQKLNESEDGILSDMSEFNPRIFIKWRKELIHLKRYYVQLNTIFDEISDNDNELIPKSVLHRFNTLCRRTERYISIVMNLQETVRQIREAYQAQISIKQNTLMQVFTLVTVIFLPLTLIVGWYGMNFVYMPELRWKYGYAAVICLCVILSAAMVWIFKKKKWM